MGIDSRLADWYHAAAIDPRDVPLKKRWTALESAVRAMRVPDVADLVRLATRRPAANGDVKSRFQRSFKEADPVFLLKDNDQELAVLASAALVQFLTSNSIRGDITAFLLRTAEFLGWETPLPDVRALTGPYLVQRSLAIRRTAPPKPPTTSNAWRAAVEAAKTEAARIGYPAWASLFVPFENVVPAAASALTAQVKSATNYTEQTARVLSEELNILWWLFNEQSSLENRSWRELGPTALTVAAPIELNELVELVPGPIASRQFLSRVMLLGGANPSDSLPISDLLVGAGRESLAKLLSVDGNLGTLTPIVAAARSWTAGDSNWIGPAELISGVSLREPRARLDIAAELLNELWTLRALGSATTT